MVRTFFNKLVVIVILITSITVVALDSMKYQNSLDTFLLLDQEGDLYTYKGIKQLFLTFDKSLSKVIKELHSQIRAHKKKLKSLYDFDLQRQLKELQDLLFFIKKHKIQGEAVIFHNEIRTKYQKLFDMVESNEDVIVFIIENLHLYDLDKSDKKNLQAFIKDLRQVSHKVSRFEDYLHGDDVDLKLQNYVFKIELIKLRNAILFDKRYKLQK